MGVANSPFRDRVVFVEGAPRSGTSWLAALLATHPAVAGVANESHLFDIGVNLLIENYELREPWQSYLSGYLSREQLIDLIRDLCDGVFGHLRDETKPQASYVLEKTPVGERHADVETARKRECFPDAWYVHIVRDGAAVTRSLLRTPFAQNRSAEDCARWWRDGVAGIRKALVDHPRYREIQYEELLADPAAECASLFDWMGLDYDEALLQLLRVHSQERYAPHEALPERGPASVGAATKGRLAIATATGRDLARRLARRSAPAGATPRGPDAPETTRAAQAIGRLAEAFDRCDPDGLRAVTSDSLELDLHTGHGDLRVTGENARAALLDAAREAFRPRFAVQSWIGTVGDPFHALLFSGRKHDGTHVNLSVNVALSDDRISRIVLISAGALRGRILGEWTPGSGADGT